jgi:hypothetical protein
MDPTPATPPPAARAKTGIVKYVVVAFVLGALYLASPHISPWDYARIKKEKVVQGNLRQLGAALDQFALDRPDRLFLRFEDIYGPQNYIKAAMPSSLGEDYRTLFPFFLPDNRYGPTIRTPQGRLVTFSYEPAPPPPPDGVHAETSPHGAKFEFTWLAGMRHGPMRGWRADGTLWCEAVFEEGRAVSAIHVTRDGRRLDELKGEVPP